MEQLSDYWLRKQTLLHRAIAFDPVRLCISHDALRRVGEYALRVLLITSVDKMAGKCSKYGENVQYIDSFSVKAPCEQTVSEMWSLMGR